MQIAQVIIENHQKMVQTNASSQTNGIGGWLAKVFGCWHREMSRPFSIQGQTYRTCLDCGARREFNPENWEMQGDFYYGLPKSKQKRSLRNFVVHQTALTGPQQLSRVNG